MFPRILNYSPKFYINSICSKAFTTKLFTFNVSIVKLFCFVFVSTRSIKKEKYQKTIFMSLYKGWNRFFKHRGLWLKVSTANSENWNEISISIDRVNYETCLVNPLKSIRQEAGRRQILWRKQFSECSLTDWIKLTPWQYLVWMIRFIKVFIHCVHDLFSIL